MACGCAYNAGHVVKIADLALRVRAAKAFSTGGKYDDGAARAYHGKGIGQRFNGLIKIDVLGRAASAGDNHGRTLAYVNAVNGVDKPAGLAVSLHHIARHGLYDVVVVIHHHVEQEAGLGQQGRLFQIGMDKRMDSDGTSGLGWTF